MSDHRYEDKLRDEKDWDSRKAKDEAERKLREYQMKQASNTADPDARKAIFGTSTELGNTSPPPIISPRDKTHKDPIGLELYSKRLKSIDGEIKEIENTISSWTGSRNKLRKEKKKLQDLKTARSAVNLLMKESKAR